MVIRSVRSDRYGGHRRIEPYAGLDFPLGAMSQILRAWDGGSEMPLPPLLTNINAVDNDDDVSLINASMRSESSCCMVVRNDLRILLYSLIKATDPSLWPKLGPVKQPSSCLTSISFSIYHLNSIPELVVLARDSGGTCNPVLP